MLDRLEYTEIRFYRVRGYVNGRLAQSFKVAAEDSIVACKKVEAEMKVAGYDHFTVRAFNAGVISFYR